MRKSLQRSMRFAGNDLLKDIASSCLAPLCIFSTLTTAHTCFPGFSLLFLIFVFSSLNKMPWFGFAALACTLSLLPASSFQISTPIGNSILQTANFKEPFNVTATPVDGLSCSIQYGEFIPVEVNNCRNALEKIPRDLDPHIYIRRHRSVQPASPRYIPLPARYLSDDGMCAIDVMLDQVR